MIPLLEEIKSILTNEWDPIGVVGIPEADDEYDSYAFQIFLSLQSGATAGSVKEFLDRVEGERMCLQVNPDRNDRVAKKIFTLSHDLAKK